MSFELILPDIGEGVVEAEIQKWFVQLGDRVEEDQPLVEVMTDKATVVIPSPRRGKVTKLHYAEGAVARVHAPLLVLEVEGEAAPAASGAGTALPPPPPPPGAVPTGDGDAGVESPPQGPGPAGPQARALATPAVRALARQLDVDLTAVNGSGPGGRVLREDLEARAVVKGAGAGAGGALRAPAREPAPPGPGPTAAARAPAPVTGNVEEDEVVPLRGIRRRMAERIAQSKRTAAHSTFVEQVDVTELVRVKERVAAVARAEGVKVTFMPFLVKAVVSALKRHPLLNATFDEARGELRLRRAYHVGVAAATPGGLVVPVVRGADRRSILDLAREIDRLASEAREGRARPEDVGGSTFTITSLGAQGGLFATPIINHPEVAILGVHRIRPTPVVREGQIVAREVMHLSLSFDHRVIDGQVGAAFTYAVIAYLEDPSLLFMELV